MLHNYFKIAWRNLLKRKFYAAVTIFGLSVGMTFALLVMSYVWGELRVNASLRNAGNQMIIRSTWKNPDMGTDIATLGPLGKTLKQDYPNLVANFYRFDAITVAVSRGDKHFREDVQTGDSTLLAMFGFLLLHGDAHTALNAPDNVAITASKAIKYFGKTDVLGQTLTLHNFLGGKQEFQVTAVLDDLPDNSVTHLFTNQAGIFIPFSSLEGRKGSEDNWGFPYMVTYLELQDGVKPADLEKPLKQLLQTHASADFQQNLRAYPVPLQQFYRETNNGLVKKMVLTLSGITAFILLMAVVNFVNISIGNSSVRLKEIGVRKVLGSLKRQLVGQFLAESLLLAGVAMLFSIGLFELLRPFFVDLLGKSIGSVTSLFPYSLIIPLLAAVFIGLLAGLYPAFVLSSLPSIDSMRGKLKSIKEHVYFRRTLISIQFSFALFVFAGAAIISRQVDYFFNKDLGYQKESLITVAVPRDWTPAGLSKMQGIRDELATLKEVNQASLSYEIPNGNFGGHVGIYKPGQDSTEAVHALFLGTDENYAATYGIKMLAGDFLQPKNSAYLPDRIVLNQAALKALKYADPQDALGRQVRIQGFPNAVTIAGISADFHFESMHEAIKPLAFIHVGNANSYRYLSFRIAPSNLSKSIAAIQQKWRTLMPDAPFEFTFMDDSLQKLYVSEMQLKKASQAATLLSVVVVILGILGMVSLHVARRTREVGIRKVLGATGVSIVALFLKEFLLVLLFAILIAFPPAIFLLNKWLQTYAYRIAISWSTFAWIGLAFGVVISLLVFVQTYKTALMNPVRSLKGD
ncbi:ABC transporter permease [Dyadobacter luticola]|uniref:FtsX-like permease family protein n=1 Tax=Dyadobacter luticola TaxID=1979387 RepID=A0A5R9KY93_9BACT|nr:ABC transporter permease [Dyadobacter luticola]TLV01067.1 FtsX-like permease family protein [Dyadobacter luticola]